MPGQYKCSTHLVSNAEFAAAARERACISPCVQSLRPLLGRTLVLVAHPDDEAVGCGGLLQRMKDPIIVFATDGAPRSDYFWRRYGSREAYAQVRRREAKEAFRAVGVQHFRYLCENNPVADQELYVQLERAYADLAQVIEAQVPFAILTMAYEGGHPDHDACCFLGALAGSVSGLPVWEMPLYHRAPPQFQAQRFLDGNTGCEVTLTEEELSRKIKMWQAYSSQSEVLGQFKPGLERLRPLANYDFERPPHAGELNYELWQWPMKGSDLCAAFASFRRSFPGKKKEWGTVA